MLPENKKGEEEHCLWGVEETGVHGLPVDPSKLSLPINSFIIDAKGVLW
jgi:hypothetical protein